MHIIGYVSRNLWHTAYKYNTLYSQCSKNAEVDIYPKLKEINVKSILCAYRLIERYQEVV